MGDAGSRADGNWIAFLSRMHGTQLRIFLNSAEGGEPQPLSNDKAQGIPSWSRNGARLVFGDTTAQDAVRERILEAYAEYEAVGRDG